MDGSRRPPRASGRYPVVGHTPSILRAPLETLQQWGQTDEGVVRARIAGRQFCLVSTPDPIERVLSTDARQFEKADIVRERLGRLQGGSLVLLEGDQWRERRRLLRSGFGRKQVQSAGPLTVEYATEMVEEWPTDRPVRVDEEMRTLSLSILARALFGLDLRGERTPIHEAAEDILARMDLRSVSAYLPEWVPTPRNYRFRRAVSTLHDRLDTVVATASADAPADNLLSIMLTAGLSEEQIRDELIALLFAGYDSTATALSVTLVLLGDHPEIQADLRRELDAVCGDQPPTAAALDELPLLDAVVRESLRLYPPQYVLFREPTTEVQLQGYRIDAGTTVVVAPWVVQRHPNIWEKPTQFRPARWLDGGTATDDRPEYAYVPYGGGPRYCLGAQLAKQTIRLVVATILSKRQLALRGSLDVSAGPTLSLGSLDVRACRGN